MVAMATATTDEARTVAVVEAVPETKKLVINSPFVKIQRLGKRKCDLSALIDTGRPVSFIKYSLFEEIAKERNLEVKSPRINLRNLSSEILDITGVVNINVILAQHNDLEFQLDLYILKGNLFEGELILGRDFLIKQKKFTLVYTATKDGESKSVNLFTYLPLYVDKGQSTDSLKQKIEECNRF